jgi:hypothetical protein
MISKNPFAKKYSIKILFAFTLELETIGCVVYEHLHLHHGIFGLFVCRKKFRFGGQTVVNRVIY